MCLHFATSGHAAWVLSAFGCCVWCPRRTGCFWSRGGQLLSFTQRLFTWWVTSWCCEEIFGMSPQHSCSQCLEYDTKGQVCTRIEIVWLCTAAIVCNDGHLQCNYLTVWIFFITFITDLWSLCPLSQVVPFHLHPRLAFSHLLSCPVLIILHQLAARCHC